MGPDATLLQHNRSHRVRRKEDPPPHRDLAREKGLHPRRILATPGRECEPQRLFAAMQFGRDIGDGQQHAVFVGDTCGQGLNPCVTIRDKEGLGHTMISYNQQ